jgi:biotin synthase
LKLPEKEEEMTVTEITEKSMDGAELSREEITTLFNIPLFSRESFQIQSTAREKSERACNSLAEVHAQFGLNVGPCSINCLFCSFAKCNGIFDENSELSVEEAVARTKRFEEDGANAICIMATGHYPFKKFIEASREVKRNLNEETVLYANVADLSPAQAKELKDSGHAGIYHVVRMGEGIDTPMSPQRRMETIRNAQEAGLFIGTCVEPIGPEHTVEELVEKTVMTRDIKPIFSGAMRRVPIPNTAKAKYGMVSEARMAHILGVVRHAIGLDVPGHCTHEPSIMAATTGGANLLWAESGSNPRDTEKETEGYRGWTVKSCRNVFTESEWGILDGSSQFSGNETQRSMENITK